MTFNIKDIRKLSYDRPVKSNSAGQKVYPKQIIWDYHINGLGMRVFPSGKKSFVYQYRTKHGVKRLADLGPFGVLTIDGAREKAQRWAIEILDGKDPMDERHKDRNGTLMADLCDVYIQRHAMPNKKSWKLDEGRNRLYVVPNLGNKQIQQIKRQDIAKLHDEIGRFQGKPYVANRVREQLSKMFELAKTWGYVEETFINPAKGIDEFTEDERSDYIKPEHMPIVKRAIDKETNEVARGVIWLYLLTGKRKNEILQAKWDDLDESTRTLKIAQTKNDEVEYLSLSQEAWKVIHDAKKFRVVGNPYIFPGHNGTGHFVNISKPWDRIRKEATKNGATSVEKVTIHGLRHTFAVFAISLGGSDLGMVRTLLNQKSLRVTTVYAKHLTSAKQSALNKHGKLMRTLSEVKTRRKVSKFDARS